MFKKTINKTCKLILNLISVCSIGLIISTANATTMLELDIDTVANKAELIFEGEVLSVQAQQENGIISSYVTFHIHDVLKGDYSGDSIEMKFMGGIINGRIIEVTGSKIPSLNEHGIYFVESTDRAFLNPLLGWSQGHYLIEKGEDGVHTVNTLSQETVSQVQSGARIPRSIKKPKSVLEDDSQAALGILSSNMSPPLSVDEFKRAIIDLIELEELID